MSQNISVARVIEKLPSRFIPENAEQMESVFQFMLDDDDDFHIVISQGRCQVIEGEHIDPNVTLIMESDTMIDVINGEIDGMSAFIKGRLRAEGNVMLATKLGKLFSREKRT